MSRHISGYYSEFELGIKLGLSIWALRAWRKRGYGPPAVKFGRSVFYREADVAAFVADPTKD
jgi:hypothetical protein